MLMQEKTPSPVSGTLNKVTRARMAVNSFSMNAMSGDKLYKNQRRAIVRELFCNGYDSHKRNGNVDVPMEIHLPTEIEPFLSMRDFGTGLSESEMDDVYFVYFESTKREDEEATGAWGLGSKSPLGYCDNFSVTTFKDGWRGDYSVFLDGEGFPALAQISSGPTTEPNGVLVQVPIVDENDHDRFINEAADVLRWFDTQPKVNLEHWSLKDFGYEEKDLVPGIHLKRGSGYRAQMAAIHGHIEYPIDLPDRSLINEEVRDFLDFNLELHFENGELEYSMSREELSYSDKTIAAIEKKLYELRDGLAPKVEAMVAGEDTNWKKAGMLAAIAGDYNKHILKGACKEFIKAGKSPVHNAIKEGAFGGFQYEKLKQIAKHDSFAFAVDVLDDVKVRAFLPTDKAGTTVLGKATTRREDVKEIVDENGDKTMLRTDAYNIGIGNSSTVFVVNDTAFANAAQRIKHHYTTVGDFPKVIVLLDGVDRNTRPVNVGPVAELMKKLGNPTFVKLSEMTELPKAVRGASTGTVNRNDFVVMHHVEAKRVYRRWQDARTTWEPSTDFGNGTVYYVGLKGHRLHGNGVLEGSDAGRLATLVKYATKFGIVKKDTKVFGVRIGSIKTVKQDSNFVNIIDHIKAELAKVDLNALYASYAKNKISDAFTNDDIVNALQGDTDAAPILAVKDCAEPKLDRYDIGQLFSIAGIELDLDKGTEDVHNAETKVLEKYPLFKMYVEELGTSSRKKYTSAIVDYIVANKK